jgi:hypothetical protein
VLSIELLEGSGVDLNNRVLDDSLGSHKLGVGGIVDNIEESSLGGESLGSPGEVSTVDSEGSELVVASAASDRADLLGTELSHGRLSCHLKLSLLLENWHATSS